MKNAVAALVLLVATLCAPASRAGEACTVKVTQHGNVVTVHTTCVVPSK